MEYTPKEQDYQIRVKINEREQWKYFHRHHYMTSELDMNKSLPKQATFFTFYIYKDNKEDLFACLGVINQIAKVPAKRITRFVILPEYQGLGLSIKILNTISEYINQSGYKLYIMTYHPRLGQGLSNSDNWLPNSNNMDNRGSNNTFYKDSIHTGIRDGEKMYRFSYKPSNIDFNLIYDTLELSRLRTIRNKNNNYNDDIRAQIIKIENQIKELQEKLDLESLNFVKNQELKETKDTLNKIFKRNKRKITPEERKQLKKEYLDKKNKD